jgi:hypothetical protein
VRVTYVLIAHLPAEGVDSFQRYELAVLPLLADHQGRLERRLRSADGQTEVHLLSFPSEEQFLRFRDDPQRARHASLLEAACARIELYRLSDVP